MLSKFNTVYGTRCLFIFDSKVAQFNMVCDGQGGQWTVDSWTPRRWLKVKVHKFFTSFHLLLSNMTNLIERRENMAKQPAMHNFIVVVAVLVVVVVVVGLACPKFIFSFLSL